MNRLLPVVLIVACSESPVTLPATDPQTLEPTLDALAAMGEKGKRFALPNARILIHQIMGGYEGQATDIEIHAREVLNLRQRLDEILAEHTGQAVEKVRQDTERDNFMSAAEAQAYGIIDDVIAHR